jgi:hypothetical protein
MKAGITTTAEVREAYGPLIADAAEAIILSAPFAQSDEQFQAELTTVVDTLVTLAEDVMHLFAEVLGGELVIERKEGF